MFGFYMLGLREGEGTPIQQEFVLRETVLCGMPFTRLTQKNLTLRMPKELQSVKPIHVTTDADKCIGKVKVNPQMEFSKSENQTLYYCIQKNAEVSKLRTESLNRLDRSLTSSYYKFLKSKPDAKIVEIGGYVGNLMSRLVRDTGVKTYVVLEPVPSFYKKLTDRIQREALAVTPYNFGLGKKETELTIGIQGDGTSLKKSKGSDKGKETLKIVKVVDFFVQLGIGCHRLDLLTINCEGCEFDVIEMLTSTSLVENIDYIQFQPHNSVFNDAATYLCLYCRLRRFLSRTHQIAYEYPHIWETWKRKGIS